MALPMPLGREAVSAQNIGFSGALADVVGEGQAPKVLLRPK